MSVSSENAVAVAPARLSLELPEAPRRQVLSGATHLAFFTIVQLLVYFDRSVLYGLVGAIEVKFGNVTDIKLKQECVAQAVDHPTFIWHAIDEQCVDPLSGLWAGLLGSGFMGGFIVASPIVALMRGSTAKIMGIGLSIWCGAAVVAAFAPSYQWLLMARIAAGAGEAAYVSLAPPMIDDTAPPAMRSAYLSIYFAAIFVGMALGFMLQAPFKEWDTARWLFLLEAMIMIPFVVFILKKGDRFHVAGDPVSGAEAASGTGLELQSTGSDQNVAEEPGSPMAAALVGNAPLPWFDQVKAVLESRTYVLLLIGYSASIFSLGGFAFWVPQFCKEVLKVTKTQAGLRLGAVSAIAGLLGTVLGGLVLDYYTTVEEAAHEATHDLGCGQRPERPVRAKGELGIRGRVAVRIAYQCSMIAVPFVMLAMLFGPWYPWFFFAALAVGQLFVFMSTAPVNVAMLEASPSNLRGLAMGICTTATHLLGDVISPVAIGKVNDLTGSLLLGVWILAMWPVWSILFWKMALDHGVHQGGG